MRLNRTHSNGFNIFFYFCLLHMSRLVAGRGSLRTFGRVEFIKVKESDAVAQIPCIYDGGVDGNKEEIFLFQNKSLIAQSTDSRKYNPQKGFTVDLPTPLPAIGVSYECRIFSKDGSSGQHLITRVFPDDVFQAEPASQIGVLRNDSFNLTCATRYSSWTPLKILHNLKNEVEDCDTDTSAQKIFCRVNATESSGGLYHCIQGMGNETKNILQTQILSYWSVREVPHRVAVILENQDGTVNCSANQGAIPQLEFCSCATDGECATIRKHFDDTNFCEPVVRSKICTVEVVDSTDRDGSQSTQNLAPNVSSLEVFTSKSVKRDVSGKYVFRCYARVGKDNINCNRKSLLIEVSIFSRQLLVVLIIVSLVLLLLALILAIVYRRKFMIQKTKVQKLTDQEVEEFLNGNQGAIDSAKDINDQAHLLPYNRSFEIPKERLHFEKQLGAGAYGTVLKARAEGIFDTDGKSILTVAVKTISPSAELEYFKALLVELKIMIHIGKHINVVNLLGAVTDKIQRREIFLVVEYCRFGDLHNYFLSHGNEFVNQLEFGKINASIVKKAPPPSYCNVDKPVEVASDRVTYSNVDAQPSPYENVELDQEEEEPFTTTSLLSWAYQIAKGMEYLDSKRVLHGDLAARNILLADNQLVKIADFGLARQVYNNAEYTKTQRQKLPIKWMAPESLTRMVFSTKSDVWSYGITLHEFFTLGETPYPGLDLDGFLEKLLKGYRMKQAKMCPNDIYHIMVMCWHDDPEERPPFGEIANTLGRSLMELKKDHYTRLSKLWGAMAEK